MSYNTCIDLMRRDNYKEAIKCYQNHLKKDKDNPFTIYQIGKCYLSINEYKKAHKFFTKALDLKPDQFSFWLALGSLYMTEWKTDFRKAIEYFEKSRKLKPDFENTLFLLGVCYNRIGKLEKAEDVLITCFKINPNFIDAAILLSEIQKRLGRF
jgi:tetratricopeptide (TPR) repeat protein